MAYKDLVLAYSPSLYWDLAANGAMDLSGNGRTGTGAGGVSIGGFSGSPITGETTSTDLDGSNDYVDSTSYSAYATGSTRTFTGWAYRDNSAGSDVLVTDQTGTALLWLTAGGNYVEWYPNGATPTIWVSAWAGNTQWVHWALVHDDNANAELFINGVSAGSQAAVAYSGTGMFRIGAYATSGGAFDGKVAHVSVFERALTTGQIAQLYQVGVGTYHSFQARELPPLRQHILVSTPGGKTYRWGGDERKPENVPSGLSYSSVMPGGHETLECTLPRKSRVDYQDLQRLSTITVLGAGERILAEHRLEKTPRVSGDEMSVSPQAVGLQAVLEDDQLAADVWVDRDLTHWREPGRARQLALLLVNHPPNGSANVSPDTSTGVPALELAVDGAWESPSIAHAETWYDAGPGSAVASVYADWAGINQTNFELKWHSSSTDDATSEDSADIYTVAAGATTYTPTARRFFAWTWSYNSTPAGADGEHFYVNFRRMTVWGKNSTKRGTPPTDGVYASDVIANAVGRWTNLRYTTGTDGTIQSSGTLIIPQLEFREPTTVAEIIAQASRFGLQDWAVWEGPRPNQPTFYFNDRNARGKRWRARVGPAKLQETGPQVDRLWNNVLVRYQDVDGSTKTVGRTGALTDATSAYLVDTDPLNPVNQAQIWRTAVLDMGIVSTVTAATEVGRQFLVRSKELDTSGQAELVGHVTDDHGVVFSAASVRAGDQITFVDAADTSYRRIVKASYSHDSRATSIDLDSPPEGLSDLLERLGVSLLVGTSLPTLDAMGRPT